MAVEAIIENSEAAILARVFDASDGVLSAAAAQSWLRLRLPAKDEERLRELSLKSKGPGLTEEEGVLLENYLHVGRLLDLMRSKARRSLQAT